MKDVDGNEIKVLYRAQECGDEIKCIEWYVASETKCGYWITTWRAHFGQQIQPLQKEKWIAKNAHRPFAHETKVDAMHALLHRKVRHVYHVERKYTQLQAVIRRLRGELASHGIKVGDYKPRPIFFNEYY